MYLRTYLFVAFFVLSLLSLTGCQKLKEEKNFTLKAGDIKSFSVDGPGSDQQLSVVVTSVGSPVNVHIVTEKEHQATEDALGKEKKPDAAKVLASKDNVENGTIEATIPVKTGFSVFISGAKKKADVTVKIEGK